MAIGVTGTTVTSAGLVLAGTFLVLAIVGGTGTGGSSQILDIGIGLALGILMDTFLVRTLLVPSTVVLLGRWNWWPSRLKVQQEAGAAGRSRQRRRSRRPIQRSSGSPDPARTAAPARISVVIPVYGVRHTWPSAWTLYSASETGRGGRPSRSSQSMTPRRTAAERCSTSALAPTAGSASSTWATTAVQGTRATSGWQDDRRVRLVRRWRRRGRTGGTRRRPGQAGGRSA